MLLSGGLLLRAAAIVADPRRLLKSVSIQRVVFTRIVVEFMGDDGEFSIVGLSSRLFYASH